MKYFQNTLENDIEVQNFVIRTIMSQKNVFSEDDISLKVFESFTITLEEKEVVKEMVVNSIETFLRTRMIQKVENGYKRP